MDERDMNDEHYPYTVEKSELDDQALVAGVLAGNRGLWLVG
jgi:hypothetical protein